VSPISENRARVGAQRRSIEPLAFLYQDDGAIPNNPTLPFLVYPKAIDLSGRIDPAVVIEETFQTNGWNDNMWRNGVYPFPHYHSMIHEAIGIACGRVRVRFGGRNGREIDLEPGDVAVLPAGTGHQRVSAGGDLLVVGAYPPSGRYNLCRGSRAEHARALKSIPLVPMPESDPVYGADGPLVALWGRDAIHPTRPSRPAAGKGTLPLPGRD
jgi:uncharacterized protein YjlB